MAKKREEEFGANAVALLADLLSNIGHRSLPKEPTELNVATEQQDRALSRILFNYTLASEAQDTEAEVQEMPAVTSMQAPESQAAARHKQKRKGTSSAASRPIKKKALAKTPETVTTDEGETGSGCFQQTNKRANTQTDKHRNTLC